MNPSARAYVLAPPKLVGFSVSEVILPDDRDASVLLSRRIDGKSTIDVVLLEVVALPFESFAAPLPSLPVAVSSAAAGLMRRASA